MSRERRNAPTPEAARRARGATEVSPGERVRRRLAAAPEITLTDEELRALADDGIDPDDVRRLARERSDPLEASVHDRDTVRDDLEGLVLGTEEDY